MFWKIRCIPYDPSHGIFFLFEFIFPLKSVHKGSHRKTVGKSLGFGNTLLNAAARASRIAVEIRSQQLQLDPTFVDFEALTILCD